MKLKDVRDAYYYYTQKTSDILRYLSFAGIGVVWIFRSQAGDKVSLPKDLILPTCFLIIGLVLDLAQYLAGSIIWGAYNKFKQNRKTKEDAEFEAPPQLNWATLFFFWSKLVSISLAYYLILSFLRRLFIK
jgi:hypothetical protein